MNEQRMCEVAETALKRRFSDVKLVRADVWPCVHCIVKSEVGAAGSGNGAMV